MLVEVLHKTGNYAFSLRSRTVIATKCTDAMHVQSCCFTDQLLYVVGVD